MDMFYPIGSMGCRGHFRTNLSLSDQKRSNRVILKAIDIDAGFIPEDQTLCRKTVPQVMKAWAPAFRPPQPGAPGYTGEELLYRISHEAFLAGLETRDPPDA